MPKTVPQRTCIGCRTKKAKRDLVRIILGKDGDLIIDRKNKTGGRGAYICQAIKGKKLIVSDKCLKMALEKKAFQQAFKTKIDAQKLWQKIEKKLKKKQVFNAAPQ